MADMDRDTRIEIQGRTRTAAEWARLNGLSVETIVRRVAQGWNLADAATEPLRAVAGARLTVGGRTRTIAEWAVEAGIQRRLVTARGETHTTAEWSRLNGIPQTTICERLRRGWDPERAVIEPVLRNGWSRDGGLMAHGERLSLEEWSKRTGIPASTISTRLQRGWSPESAVDVPVRTYRRRDA